VYRNICYTLDRTHPLQLPCGARVLFCLVSEDINPSSRQWECENPEGNFQRVWEGWEAGFMAFHAFHTLSFARPALFATVLSTSLRFKADQCLSLIPCEIDPLTEMSRFGDSCRLAGQSSIGQRE
jgi:hypothetical protein